MYFRGSAGPLYCSEVRNLSPDFGIHYRFIGRQNRKQASGSLSGMPWTPGRMEAFVFPIARESADRCPGRCIEDGVWNSGAQRGVRETRLGAIGVLSCFDNTSDARHTWLPKIERQLT